MRKHTEIPLVAALVGLAVLARWAGFGVTTNDMDIFFQWYHRLGALDFGERPGAAVGNYNAPFVYVLTMVLSLPGPVLVKMKAVFVLFDVVLAWFTYRIVRLRHPGGSVAVAAALGMLLLPTVVINASWWGQMDAMWAAPALGGVYYLLRDKPWIGAGLCGAALAVKPQGVFIFPLLILLALAGRVRRRTLLAAPAVFVAAAVPAILFGRDPVELLTIYDLDRQARNVPALTLRAPSMYAFVPPGPLDGTVRLLGYVFTAAAVLGICWVLVARGAALSRARVVTAATLFALLVPFLLPGMHERYFFLADVLTVVLAVYRPRLWFVPLLVQAGSLLAYQPYLFGRAAPVLPLTVAATLMLGALLAVGKDLLSQPAARPVLLPARPV